MSTKMKGLLKGLRYISQIFEEDEEKEMQIGFPTDVKHVAHIGWDGPSVTSPSWMTEFKSPPAGASAPSQLNGEANSDLEDVKWVSEDASVKKGVKESPGRDLPDLPKSSRRQPSVDSIGSMDSPLGSPSQKSRSSRRRHSKQKEVLSPRGGESSSNSLPNIPKKTRRKKSKDGDGGGSVGSVRSGRSKDKGSRHGSRHGSDDGSVSKPYSGEGCPNPALAVLKEEEVKG